MDAASAKSLLSWIQSFQDKFPTVSNVTRMEELCDGVLLSKIMHSVGAEYLNTDLIQENTGANWALKSSNLKALVRSIELFYHDELGQLCDASELIDVARIAKDQDVDQVAKLAELVLGAAVQSRNRTEYIHPIMDMEASEQASLMHMIENLMHRFQIASPTPGHTSSTGGGGGGNSAGAGHHRSSLTNNSFNYLTHEGDNVDELQLQLQQCIEKAAAMEMKFLDAERTKRELAESLENSLRNQRALQDQMASMQEEREKLLAERQQTLARDNRKIQHIVESEVHVLNVQLETKNEELLRLKRESAEKTMALEHEIRRQADELDIARSKVSQLGKLEASIVKYKHKLEEMNSCKSQIKDLESMNQQYLEKMLDMESTIKTMPTLKAMVEKYKNQVVDLETANVEAMSSNQVKDQKIKRLQEELESALSGKEFLESQVEELRQLGNGTSDGGDQSHSPHGSPSSGVGGGFGGRMQARGMHADALFGQDNNNPVVLKEKIARLEKELGNLQSGGAAGESFVRMQSELDMAIKAKEALQRAVLELKNRNEQLQEDMDKCIRQAAAGTTPAGAAATSAATPSTTTTTTTSSSSSAAASTNANSSMVSAAGVNVLVQQIASYEEKLALLRQDAEQCESLRATVAELTTRLKDKESKINELAEQKTKLENYTKKTLHAVQTKYMVAVSSHRNQLSESQEKADGLEKKVKELRASYVREQALMMSCLYEVGAELQRRTLQPPTSTSNQTPAGNSSWLPSKRAEERARRRNL